LALGLAVTWFTVAKPQAALKGLVAGIYHEFHREQSASAEANCAFA